MSKPDTIDNPEFRIGDLVEYKSPIYGSRGVIVEIRPGKLEPTRPVYVVNYGKEVIDDQEVMKTTLKHNTQLRLAPGSKQ